MGNQSSVNVGGTVVRIKKQIAEGGFAYVYLVEDEQGHPYALKRVIVPLDDAERNALARKEHQMLQRIPPHQNIVRCVASGVQDAERGRSYFTLMELCNGSAWNLMCDATRSGQPLPEKLVMRVFRDAAMAIHHLHSLLPPIAHRDIKVENLLLGEDGLFKLCDFGSCTTQHKSFATASTHEITLAEEEINKNTTLAYRSPEQADLYQRKRVCEKVDIWALGVLLYKLSCGRTPFEDQVGNVEKMGILSNRVRWPQDFRYSVAIQQFVGYMMNPDPETRPSALDVLVWGQKAYEDEDLPYWPNTNVESMMNVVTPIVHSETQKNIEAVPVKPVVTSEDPKPTLLISDPFMDESFFSQSSWLDGVEELAEAEDPAALDEVSPQQLPNLSYLQDDSQDAQYNVGDTHRRSVSPKQPSSVDESKTSDIVRRASAVSSNLLNTARQISGSVSTFISLIAPDSEVELWALKATSSKGGFPKAKYVRKIVVGIWENELNMSELLHELVGRPWGKNPVVCVKILVVLMKVLQQGPPRVLGSCAQYIGFLSEVIHVWGTLLNQDQSPVSGSERDQLTYKQYVVPMAQYITKLASLIQQKLQFHQVHPEYGHHFTTIVMMVGENTLPQHLQIDQMKSVLLRMLSIQNSLISVQRQAFSSCVSIKQDELSATITGSLLPLVEESYILLVACTDLLSKLWSETSAHDTLDSMKDQYNQQFLELKQFYRNAEMVPFIHTMNVLSLMNVPDTSPLDHLSGSTAGTVKMNHQRNQHVTLPNWFAAAANSEDAQKFFANLEELQAHDAKEVDDEEGYGFLPDAAQFASASKSDDETFTPFAARSTPISAKDATIVELPVRSQPDLAQPKVVTDLVELGAHSEEISKEKKVHFASSNKSIPTTSKPLPNIPVVAPAPFYRNMQLFRPASKSQTSQSKPIQAPQRGISTSSSSQPDHGIQATTITSIPGRVNTPTQDSSLVVYHNNAGSESSLFLTQPSDESSNILSNWSSSSTAESLLDVTTITRGITSHDGYVGVGARPASFSPFRDTGDVLQPQVPSATRRNPAAQVRPSAAPDIDAIYNPSAQPWRDSLYVSLRPAFEECVRSFRGWGAELDFNEFSVEKVIGTGAFAVVYRATYRGRKIAIKKLLSTGGAAVNAKTINDFRTEADFMRTLRHPNIVALLGTCTNPLCTVMEFCDKGALFAVLANRAQELSWSMRKCIMTDLANGMNYLHTRRPMIIHRDLKSLNVLITADWKTKVTDFGLSRYTPNSASEQMTGQIGTFHWMAPEVINSNYYTEKADVYSYGIILWEIITRRTPYEGMQPLQVVSAVVTRNERPPIPDSTHPLLRELMQDCWATAPPLRPSFAQVLNRLRALPAE